MTTQNKIGGGFQLLRGLRDWTSLIAVVISLLSLGFSFTSYFTREANAYEKVSFNIGVTNQFLSQANRACNSAQGAVGITFCEESIAQSKLQIRNLKDAIAQQAGKLSPKDYKSALLAMEGEKAALSDAQLQLDIIRKENGS